MTSLKIVFTCLVLGEITQTNDLKSSSPVCEESRETGEDINLKCVKGYGATQVFWYKKTLDEELRLISSVYYGTITFQGEFRNNRRFSMDAQNINNHLTISDLKGSDSGTYYCLGYSRQKLEFLETIHVSVKSSNLNIPAVVHPSESETIHHEGSVTLNCTVQAETCDGEHSVYWFKNSEESQPGLLYTSGGRNEQCVREPDSQTHTCEYSLPVKNLNVSDAGTYYCAVVSCGHILFGNGTKLDFKDGLNSSVLVFFLSGALTFAAILVVVLAILLCKSNKRNSSQSQDAVARFSRNLEAHREADNLFYADVRVKKPNASRRQRNTTSECVYSIVKK